MWVLKLVLEAGVETAVLFHHDYRHDDKILDQMGFEGAKVAEGTRTKVLMGRDGMVVDVGRRNSVDNDYNTVPGSSQIGNM